MSPRTVSLTEQEHPGAGTVFHTPCRGREGGSGGRGNRNLLFRPLLLTVHIPNPPWVQSSGWLEISHSGSTHTHRSGLPSTPKATCELCPSPPLPAGLSEQAHHRLAGWLGWGKQGFLVHLNSSPGLLLPDHPPRQGKLGPLATEHLLGLRHLQLYEAAKEPNRTQNALWGHG